MWKVAATDDVCSTGNHRGSKQAGTSGLAHSMATMRVSKRAMGLDQGRQSGQDHKKEEQDYDVLNDSEQSHHLRDV